MTDPTKCEYVGWWGKFKQQLRERFKGAHGQFSLGRAVVQEFAGPNILPRMESAAMALLFKLVQENPNDTLFRDMQMGLTRASTGWKERYSEFRICSQESVPGQFCQFLSRAPTPN